MGMMLLLVVLNQSARVRCQETSETSESYEFPGSSDVAALSKEQRSLTVNDMDLLNAWKQKKNRKTVEQIIQDLDRLSKIIGTKPNSNSRQRDYYFDCSDCGLSEDRATQECQECASKQQLIRNLKKKDQSKSWLLRAGK